jgi:multidrug resistance efflux pump
MIILTEEKLTFAHSQLQIAQTQMKQANEYIAKSRAAYKALEQKYNTLLNDNKQKQIALLEAENELTLIKSLRHEEGGEGNQDAPIKKRKLGK